MLELTNVKKFYDTRLVLEIPFLQLENSIYWVKGTNGSGKTSLLKMVAGLLPFEGDILFKDISLKKKALTYRQNVSWAEAEPLYPAFMTGIELISLYRSIRKATQNTVDMLIGFFNMNEYVNDAIGTYSTGMIKKLSLVLAFIGDPSLIVLDEPLITLDSDALTSVSNFILEKHKNTGTIFLMSTHQEQNTLSLLPGKELIVSNRSVFYIK
jgi:ABC-2 type transport system ATP-binding protein